jgi:CheY-like chemotaxis protein
MPSCALILDRDIGSCLVLKKMIIALGLDCDVVHEMADGLKAVTSKNYSIILIGCLHGDPACWEVTRAIKLLPRGTIKPILIGLLSFSDSEMQQRCSEMGMEGQLSKPVSRKALSACIVQAQFQSAPSNSNSVCSLQSASNCSSRDHQRKEFEKGRSSPNSSIVGQLELENVQLQEAGPLHFGELNRS